MHGFGDLSFNNTKNQGKFPTSTAMEILGVYTHLLQCHWKNVYN